MAQTYFSILFIVLVAWTMVVTSSDDDAAPKLRRILHGGNGSEEDSGPGWPIPGPESYKTTQKLWDSYLADGNRASFPNIIQPISFINFIQTDGTGKVSYEKIVAQVAQLNKEYSGTEAKQGDYASPTDTNIRFMLAGIRYVVNNDYFNLCALPSYINVIRPRYMMDGAVHLNIYVCWCQYDLGLSWLPYDSWFGQPISEDSFALGSIVHWQLLPGNNFNGGMWSKGNILTHEVGHSKKLISTHMMYFSFFLTTKMFTVQVTDCFTLIKVIVSELRRTRIKLLIPRV